MSFHMKEQNIFHIQSEKNHSVSIVQITPVEEREAQGKEDK